MSVRPAVPFAVPRPTGRRLRHLATGAGAVLAAGTLAVLAVVPGATASPADPISPSDKTDPAAMSTPARYRTQKLIWKQCGEPELKTRCARVTVPRDWNAPDAGPDIRVAISRTEPKSGKADRVVFGNPGGPGAPGLGMAPFLADQPGLSHHLSIGFDPRGTGDSTNVTCAGAPAYSMDARDRDRANLDLIAHASRLTGDYCSRLSRDLLPFITTEQTVKDLDLVRALLGYDRMDYVGYSGGTWLGAYYQRYFPGHTGRFVLDSNTDFTAPWQTTFEAQPQAFERRFREDFGEWAAKYPGLLGLGGSPAAVHRYYERLRADLKRTPVELDVYGFAITIDQNTLDGSVIGALYTKTEFQGLAETMKEFRQMWDEQETGGVVAARKQFARLSETEQEHIARLTRQHVRRPLLGRPLGRPVAEDASDATFYAITCNDTRWTYGRAYGDLVSAREGRRFPLIGWGLNQNPCEYWDRPDLRMPVPDGRGVPVTLMVQSLHDPATNARLAIAAHERYAGSRLITVAREGDHGIYGGVNACTDKLVNAYLSTGVAPAKDVTCLGEGIPAPRKQAPAPAAAPAYAATDPLGVVAGLTDRLAGTVR